MTTCICLLLVAPVLASAAVANIAAQTGVSTKSTGKQEATQGATPIQQVLKLLTGMKEKGIAAKQSEQIQFSAFQTWCQNEISTTTQEVATGKAKIRELESFIKVKEREIRKLANDLIEIKGKLGAIAEERERMVAQRNKESTEYSEAYKDTADSIAAVDGALKVLQEQSSDSGQAALLQVRGLRSLPVEAKRAITDFLQLTKQRKAHQPDAYEFQSKGVVDMLKQLQDKFRTQLNDLTRDESKSRHAFDLFMQSASAREKDLTRQLDRLKIIKAETEQEKAKAEADLSSTQSAYNEDSQNLADTKALCSQKKLDYDSRQKLRASELDTISKAIEIISSTEVSGTAEKYLPTLVELRTRHRRTALAQLRASEVNPMLEKAAAFLEGQADAQDSRLLSEVAEKIKANPFSKVMKLVKGLMYKLKQEAAAETVDKGWCDAEVATNKQTREAKTEALSKLDMAMEDLTATIATLTDEIAELTSEIAELRKAQAEATELRDAAKKKAEETIADAKLAQAAVQNALVVLQTFYANAAEATAFAQQQAIANQPEIFGAKPYKGLAAEGGSAIDFLQVILSDFVRLAQETSATEAMEVENYKKYMYDSNIDLAEKDAHVKNKNGDKTEAETELNNAKTERQTTQAQLTAALAYYAKLKPKCVDTGITYEERKKRRESEIQSLTDALNILQGSDIA